MALYSNDVKMKYDLLNHRYVLTDDGFKAYSGYSLKEKLDVESKDQDLTVAFFLNRVSENVYGILLAQAESERASQCFLALSENRTKIYNALCREASDMMVANDDLSEQSKDAKNPCSIGLQIIIETLYGRFANWRDYTFGEDY